MNKFLLASICTLVVAASCPVSAQQSSLSLSPRQVAEQGYISVSYGQPSKRDRTIFGGLVPYDEVWRTGANQATEITFNKDVTIGGKPLAKGTYTLFTIPRKGEWTIIFNSQLKQWGAFSYDQQKDVLRINVPSEQTKQVQEKFTIDILPDKLALNWDKTLVYIPVSLQAN